MNKIINADFLTNELPDNCCSLIIADPPYYETKGEFDFIWETFDDYLKDVERWAKECKRLLADNGSLFWWGHAKKIAYSQIILDQYFDLQNVIKWRKTDCQTRIGYNNFNSFPPVTEHLLFYTQDKENATKSVLKIRDYIRGEIKKAKGKIVLNEINKALGTATNGGGVASACLSLEKSEPTMLTEEMYIKLQDWCKPYLTKNYLEIRSEYDKLKRTFDNFLKMEDVWDFAQDVHQTGAYDHPTQKTEKISRLIIKTTTKQKELVLVPFVGSGTECAAAAIEKRNFVGYEINKTYSDRASIRVRKVLREPTLF